MDRHARVETSPERGEKAISENLAAKVSASLTTATAPPTTADWPWTTTKSRPPRLYKLRSHDYTIAFIVGFCECWLLVSSAHRSRQQAVRASRLIACVAPFLGLPSSASPFAGFLTEVGIYVVYTPILPYHLRDLGYTNVESAIGYAASCYAAGLAVGAPIVGYLGQVFPVSHPSCRRDKVCISWLARDPRGSPCHLSPAPPPAMLTSLFPSECLQSKRAILLVHFAVLASAIMLFLFVQTVAGMLVARTFQGLAGAGIWTIGMALLSDNTDRAYAGRLMGLAMLLFSVSVREIQGVHHLSIATPHCSSKPSQTNPSDPTFGNVTDRQRCFLHSQRVAVPSARMESPFVLCIGPE